MKNQRARRAVSAKCSHPKRVEVREYDPIVRDTILKGTRCLKCQMFWPKR